MNSAQTGKTPICDFVRQYNSAKVSRLHMPGHKGRGVLGCEALDITEIDGADALYEAQGIIAQSEENAASLFGSARTCFSTEGSSQCIRAMVLLALQGASAAQRRQPYVLAARNVHKALIYACAVLQVDAQFLYAPAGTPLCSCPITALQLEQALNEAAVPPIAVYVTSPDYLGNLQDIAALSAVCRRFGVPLLVDNAHGAYLKFLQPSLHPLDAGADLCCDSAHKTLPVLTGGAYLHISKQAPALFARQAKNALAVFGSTSPSYLTLQSLDACNAYLADNYPARLANTVARLEDVKRQLRQAGVPVLQTEPLKLVIAAYRWPKVLSGTALAGLLRQNGAECEFADREHLVAMLTPENSQDDLRRLRDGVLAACKNEDRPLLYEAAAAPVRGEKVLSLHSAVLGPQQSLPVEQALGRICASPTVSCPPAVPVVISGERITAQAIRAMTYYGIEQIQVCME